MRCVGGLSVCCKLVQDNLLLPESGMCIVVSSIGCGTVTKGIKTPLEDVGLEAGESPQRRRSLPIAMCQTPEDTNSATAGVASLLLQEGPYPAKLCRADCMKEDCRTTTCCLHAFDPSARQSAVAFDP
ncbi:hypothetical protein AVEN_228333-1 [Araneus ventricosus]|uniref:Uncharacterized protein n=1 Tax=Araneus ventricosus TaxID=182803 RepID=A0A4Y2K6L9_ARAVE|nr:hypothetical protein AVEN_228333-1 [Araneus ventricosus]